MKTRFHGYIHSIVGHMIMISPDSDASQQYKCALDDFESIIPTANAGQPFTFDVKRDRIGVEHYRQWLGLAKIENDRLASIENGLLALIKTIPVGQPTPTQVGPDDRDVQDMASKLYERHTI